MWPNPQETADLIIFTEETLNEIFFTRLLSLSETGGKLLTSIKNMQM